jgi:thioredoxin-related protein
MHICDFPVKKNISPQDQAENNRLAKSFNVTSYPTQILLGPSGKVLDRRQGYSPGPITPYIDRILSFATVDAPQSQQ